MPAVSPAFFVSLVDQLRLRIIHTHTILHQTLADRPPFHLNQQASRECSAHFESQEQFRLCSTVKLC